MSYESGPWMGESGFEYMFHVYQRGEPVPSRPGLFIYAKKDRNGIWFPVYMGQGDLSVCCDDADLLACIDAKGATHIHMRLCSTAQDRAEELADLLRRSTNSFVPEGCNTAMPTLAGPTPTAPGA